MNQQVKATQHLLILFLLDLLQQTCFTVNVLESSFVQKEPACMTDLAIYMTLSYRSKMYCASTCLDDNCDKFIWDSANRTCMLHLENATFTTVVTVQPKWKLYRRTSRDVCSVVGYEFYSTLNMCYKLYDSVMATWVNAQTVCQGDGGNLVSISNDDAREKITDILKCGRRTWVGLRNESWLNGDSFVNIFGPSTKLDNHDSAFTGDTDNTCGSIVPRQDEVYVIDNSCYIRERGYFICEINEGP